MAKIKEGLSSSLSPQQIGQGKPRNKRKLDLIASDSTQTKITSYFEVLDQITTLIRQNKFLSDLIQQSAKVTNSTNDDTSKTTDPFSVLHHLLANIENNTDKCPKGRRQNEIIKKFPTVLYIYAGPMAYDFIQYNMPEALPSLRTVQLIMQSQYSHSKKESSVSLN